MICHILWYLYFPLNCYVFGINILHNGKYIIHYQTVFCKYFCSYQCDLAEGHRRVYFTEIRLFLKKMKDHLNQITLSDCTTN